MPKLVTFHCPDCDADFEDLVERSANGLNRRCEGCFWIEYLKKLENCPAECKHTTFHYCGHGGTHCDKHCVCPCHLCVKERDEQRAKANPSP